MNPSRIVNQPIKLWWAGWETDTHKLGNQGWQVSAEQNVYNNSIRIAIRHPEAEIEGITEIEEFLYRETMRNSMYTPTVPTMLRFNIMGKQIFIKQMDSPNITFNTINTNPLMVNSEIKSLEDFANFAPLEVPTQEIYLKEANMSQILQMALERQAPEQERISGNFRKLNLEGLRTGKLHTGLRLVN